MAKTLDEVIKPVRCGCGGEAKVWQPFRYVVICGKCNTKSADYDTEAEAVEAWNRAMGATDTNVGDKNDPLTWDELRKMLDQPIWLEERKMCDDPFEGNWRLIDCFYDDVKYAEKMRVTGSEGESYPVYHRDMGEYWRAFRKERKER